MSNYRAISVFLGGGLMKPMRLIEGRLPRRLEIESHALIPRHKKTALEDGYIMLCLVAGVGFEPTTFRL